MSIHFNIYNTPFTRKTKHPNDSGEAWEAAMIEISF